MRDFIERHAAIIGAAAFAFVLAAPEAGAQNEAAALIQEVVRKANTGEDEAGFCQTTQWRVETPETLAANTAFYDRAVVGSTKTFLNSGDAASDDYCGYVRIEAVYSEGGRRCVRARLWYCSVGKRCGSQVNSGCRGDQAYDWK